MANQFYFAPDFDISMENSELDELDRQLAVEEESILAEILNLQKEVDSANSLFDDMLTAVKDGAEKYVDSMTDTNDSFNKMKDPSKVKDTDNQLINRKTNPNENSRTKGESNSTPFDLDTNVDHYAGMSEVGKAKLDKYVEAYSQRTKSITALSGKENSINYKSDESANFESLSGLRGYRVGPVVPYDQSVDELVVSYNKAKERGSYTGEPTTFVRQHNYATLDKKLMEEFGFKSQSEASEWRRENHLTIHEGPNGLFLVPTDVHDGASHSGYCSQVVNVIKNNGSKESIEELDKFVRDEQVAMIKHEVQVRGVRVMKGIGLSVVKDIIKCFIVVLFKEIKAEFSQKSEDNFAIRMKRVFKNCGLHVWNKFKEILQNMLKNIGKTILNEFLTALNDFVFKTFKNVFKFVRQMFGSIKSAFKIIIDKSGKYTWKEKIFEASKILCAGVVGIIGFGLNEIIEKGLTTIGFPFAGFVAECLSGLFAGILSSIVLMLFDHFKAKYKASNALTKKLQEQSKYLIVVSARVQVSEVRLNVKMVDTLIFMQNLFSCMELTYQHLQNEIEKSKRINLEFKALTLNVNTNTERLKNKYLNDNDF